MTDLAGPPSPSEVGPVAYAGRAPGLARSVAGAGCRCRASRAHRSRRLISRRASVRRFMISRTSVTPGGSHDATIGSPPWPRGYPRVDIEKSASSMSRSSGCRYRRRSRGWAWCSTSSRPEEEHHEFLDLRRPKRGGQGPAAAAASVIPLQQPRGRDRLLPALQGERRTVRHDRLAWECGRTVFPRSRKAIAAKCTGRPA